MGTDHDTNYTPGLISAIFYIRENMVNHKKMVHPPCAFAK